MKKLCLASLAVVIGLAAAVTAHATPESRAAAPFLLFQPSARSAGMGEAFVAIADDANATYYNPAAIADVRAALAINPNYDRARKLLNSLTR